MHEETNWISREHAVKLTVEQIRKARPWILRFDKATYEAHFQSYAEECKAVLNALHEAVDHDAQAKDETVMRTIADQALSLLNGGQTAKRNALDAQMSDRIVLATYFVPALKQAGDPMADAFCEQLRAAWLALHPHTPFRIGTYEEIMNGFRSKRKLCFITTAVCESEGKPDDCEELTVFRAFRDHWLAHQPGGREQIDEYYRIAPSIVTIIHLTEDEKKFYASLRHRYLEPCLAMIHQNDFDGCRRTYTDMVQSLRTQYHIV